MEIGAVVLVAIGVIAVGIGLIIVPKTVAATVEPGVAATRTRPTGAGMAATVLGAIGVLCALVGLILRVAD
jgi:hypothetical protein